MKSTSLLLEKFNELVINVRGKDKFVVLDIERYRELRIKELDMAYIETIQDIKEKKFKFRSTSQHIKKLMNE